MMNYCPKLQQSSDSNVNVFNFMLLGNNSAPYHLWHLSAELGIPLYVQS